MKTKFSIFFFVAVFSFTSCIKENNETFKLIYKRNIGSFPNQSMTPVIFGKKVFVTGGSDALIQQFYAFDKNNGKQICQSGDMNVLFGNVGFSGKHFYQNKCVFLENASFLTTLNMETCEIESRIPSNALLSDISGYENLVFTVENSGIIMTNIETEERTKIAPVILPQGLFESIAPPKVYESNGDLYVIYADNASDQTSLINLNITKDSQLFRVPINRFPLFREYIEINDGNIYIPRAGGFECRDFKTGELVWNIVRDTTLGGGVNIVFTDELMISSPNSGYLVGLNKKTGSIEWEISEYQNTTTDNLYLFDGLLYFIGFGITVVSPDNGAVLARKDVNLFLSRMAYDSEKHRIYVGGDQALYCFEAF